VAFQAGASLLEPCIYGDVCPRAAPKKYGLLGQYYDDETLQALVYERIDPWIDFGYYDETEAIAGTFMPDGLSYSARWTGFLEVPKTATYTFYVLADDGARLWVNEQQLINRWDYADPPENQASLNLQAGQRYPIKLEMHQGAGGAVVQLEWSYPGQARAVIPYRYFSHD
jgi:hypothetical protein